MTDEFIIQIKAFGWGMLAGGLLMVALVLAALVGGMK